MFNLGILGDDLPINTQYIGLIGISNRGMLVGVHATIPWYVQKVSPQLSKSWKVKNQVIFDWILHTSALIWLVVSTHPKNISQNGNLPQVGVKIKKYLKPPPSNFSIPHRIDRSTNHLQKMVNPFYDIQQWVQKAPLHPQPLIQGRGWVGGGLVQGRGGWGWVGWYKGGGGVFLLVYRLVESIYLLCLAVSRLKGV